MKARLFVTLGAAITADGKLDHSALSSDGWPVWFNPQPGDAMLSADERTDLTESLHTLWACDETRRVLCFGGPRVFRRLFEHELVAEAYLLVRPTIDGRRGAATLGGMTGEFFPTSVRCRLLNLEVRGRECLLHYLVLRTKVKRAVVT